MSVPEQWRFQWPDGTWIRWNPQTQSWEKEPPGGSASGPDEGGTPVDVADLPDVAPTSVVDPLPSPANDDVDPEVHLSDDPNEDYDTGLWIADEAEEEHPYVVPRREAASRVGRRPMVGDVLPPEETESPTASVWPAVITGMVIGVGIGLMVLNTIR